jgi:hypothetical protein
VIARAIMFTVFFADAPTLEKYGVCFRKGKDVSDLKAALQKGLKAGRGKTEYEISMVELYIKDVLKGV